jgi:uncharacterized protein
MKSNVYFVKISENNMEARVSSLLKLLREVNPFSSYQPNEIIPVKLTIGDTRCVYHIGPELVKSVVTEIKKTKAKPFLFDTNVIYKGFRQNAVDHLTLSQNKGFSHSKTGAPFIIADGLMGQDGKEYELNSDHLKRIKVPSFIGMMDSLVVLSHVTCHILSGYAGALKNTAMGMVSRPTKQILHSSLKPTVIEKKCVSCGCCIEICPVKAISKNVISGKAVIDQSGCIGCGECLCACKFDAVYVNWKEDIDIFAKRMTEAAGFILSKFKNKFFINFAFDITKECDCISTKDEKLVRGDIGILASNDMVSIDKATVDLINNRENVIEKENLEDTYKIMLEHAHEKGFGNLEYNLIKL